MLRILVYIKIFVSSNFLSRNFCNCCEANAVIMCVVSDVRFLRLRETAFFLFRLSLWFVFVWFHPTVEIFLRCPPVFLLYFFKKRKPWPSCDTTVGICRSKKNYRIVSDHGWEKQIMADSPYCYFIHSLSLDSLWLSELLCLSIFQVLLLCLSESFCFYVCCSDVRFLSSSSSLRNFLSSNTEMFWTCPPVFFKKLIELWLVMVGKNK